MLPEERIKKLLPSGSYSAEEIKEITDGLYQLANILVDDYLKVKYAKKDGKDGDDKK